MKSPDELALFNLAAPLQESGALPRSIPLSVGLIANTDPRELNEATLETAGVWYANELEVETSDPFKDPCKISAQLDAPLLQELQQLSTEVYVDRQRLSRTWRVASTVGGLLLGAGLATGMAFYGASHESKYQTVTPTSVTVAVGAASVLGGVAGSGLASRTSGSAARRKARHLIEEANQKYSQQ